MNSMSISVTWKKYTRYSNKLYCVVCVISRPCLCVSIIPGKNERGFPTYKEIADTFYRGFDKYLRSYKAPSILHLHHYILHACIFVAVSITMYLHNMYLHIS